jgi:septum formation protein
VDPSHIPEPDRRDQESPQRYAVRSAQSKVRAVGKRHRLARVIGADTVVVVGSKLLGKPRDMNEARQMLKALSGRWHEVVTGLSILDCRTGRERSSHTTSRVHFRRLSSQEIEWYLATGEYRDKAGAYAIQGYASLFIDRIEGSYLNIVGFPVFSFEQLCRRLNISLLPYLGMTDSPNSISRPPGK